MLRKERKALEENRLFSPATSLTPVRRRGRRRQKSDPDLQGKTPRSLNIRAVRQGTAAVFGFLADIRSGLFGIPATFAPESPTPAVASL